MLEPKGRHTDSLQGTWEGNLKVIASSLSKESESYLKAIAPYEASPFKIIIRKQRARVFFEQREIKPNLFRAELHMTNAVVFASNSGNDEDGLWVETWNFLLTSKNLDICIVCFSRAVNNVNVPEDRDVSKLFAMATGEFRRTAP